MYAAGNGHTYIVTALLAAGADVNAKDRVCVCHVITRYIYLFILYIDRDWYMCIDMSM